MMGGKLKMLGPEAGLLSAPPQSLLGMFSPKRILTAAASPCHLLATARAESLTTSPEASALGSLLRGETGLLCGGRFLLTDSL